MQGPGGNLRYKDCSATNRAKRPPNIIRCDLLGSVADEPPDLRHEVGKHGQGAHHVEDDEYFAAISLRIDVAVANLETKVNKFRFRRSVGLHPLRAIYTFEYLMRIRSAVRFWSQAKLR